MTKPSRSLKEQRTRHPQGLRLLRRDTLENRLHAGQASTRLSASPRRGSTRLARPSRSDGSPNAARWLLYEAANAMMTRCKRDNWLKAWALDVARRRGMRKAKIALARRLAVVMRRMWMTQTPFSIEKPA